MKKQYLFLFLLIIILYLLYLIINYKYKEYKINTYIERTKTIIENERKEIVNNKIKLEYINTNAFKNKILKESQWFINKWEKIIYITNEETYSKFVTKKEDKNINIIPEKKVYDSMTIFEKWIYFIFKKDIR